MQKIEAYVLTPQAKRLLTLLHSSRNNTCLPLEDRKEFLRYELAKPENADLKENYIGLIYSLWRHGVIYRPPLGIVKTFESFRRGEYATPT